MTTMSNAQNLYREGNLPESANQEKEYSALARRLKQHTGWVVGVMDEPLYHGHETPASLRYEHFAETWGKIPGVLVVPLNNNQLHSYEILFKGKLDILVFPYGSVYPMDASGLFSGQTFNYYLREGGAVMTTGGIPFMKQAGAEGEVVPIETPEQKTAVLDKWASKFGVKYYECAVPPQSQQVNTALLPSMPAALPYSPGRCAVVAVNSSHLPVPKPPNGNVFPERYPARQIIPLIHGVDPLGQPVSTVTVLAQDFENGSRCLYFSHEGEQHPLSPDSAHFAPLMSDLFALLANRVIAAEVETQYACYRQGEAVPVRAEIVSFEPYPVEVRLRLSIEAGGQLLFQEEQNPLLSAGKSIAEWIWQPGAFNADEYLVRLDVFRDGRVVSTAENGFVVWDAAVLQKPFEIGLRHQYFTINGRGAFITGTNYYESTRGEVMWFRPNVANLIRDHKQMHDCGINMIRPHYHHLKWFKDYLLYHHGYLFPFYDELETLQDAMPDERVWRIWDVFIYLSHKYGIIYNGDLFTLVPEEMGDPRGWFGTVEAVLDLEKRPAQKVFLKAIEQRYQNVPGITWDLFNEPYRSLDQDTVKWAADLKTVFDEIGSKRLITVGGPLHLGSSVDYDCPHGRISPDFINQHDYPVLLQELHLDRPEPLEAELDQAEELRYYAVLALRNGVAGICPWSWTRQMRLWQDTYEHHYTFPMEKWDDRLGLHTHEDATIKVAGQVFKDIALMMKTVDLVAFDRERLEIETTRGRLIANVSARDSGGGHSIIHASGGQCFAGMARETIEWDGKRLVDGPAGAYVYFYCTEDDFGTAHQLFLKTEQGGTVWITRQGVQSVELVDGFPPQARALQPMPFRTAGGRTAIDVDASITRCWLRIRF